MAYKSILDDIAEQLEKEGHKTYRTNFDMDRASFNLPPEMKPPTIGEQTASTQPVGGRNQPGQLNKGKQVPGQPGANQQLSLPGSSTIQSAAYWPSKKYLVVSFKSGGAYSYDGVGVVTVDAWEQASSAGSWFYKNIRMSFKYQKLG